MCCQWIYDSYVSNCVKVFFMEIDDEKVVTYTVKYA